MSFYADHVLPRIIHVTCGMKALNPRREQLCAGLSGEVLEIGFGSGSNVPFYPPSVTSVTAVEPTDTSWKLAGKRLARSTVPVQRSGLDGQSLPFEEDRFDTALSTFTLCTIPDHGAALAELRRVLKPGGTLHFFEHGLAPEPDVQRRQYRFEPIQKRVAGGCHLTRDVVAMLESAGFTVTSVERFYQPGEPKIVGAMSLGVATSE